MHMHICTFFMTTCTYLINVYSVSHLQGKMHIFSLGSLGGGRISRSGTVGDVPSNTMTWQI